MIKKNLTQNKADNALNQKELKFMISTCLSLELYEEAYEYSKALQALKKNILDEQEMNLYMRSLKGKLNQERNAWKIIIDFENYEAGKELLPKKFLQEKKIVLENEIKKLCLEVQDNCRLLENNINENDNKSKIFYLKLKADYLRYLGEIANEDEFEEYKIKCREYYNEAYELCEKFLPYTSGLYLSVALNYSVFLYTLTDDLQEAHDKAYYVYNQAMKNLSKNEEEAPEIENILKSIEENLTIWRIEIAEIHQNN